MNDKDDKKFILWELNDNKWNENSYDIMVYKTIPDLLKDNKFEGIDFGKIRINLSKSCLIIIFEFYKRLITS